MISIYIDDLPLHKILGNANKSDQWFSEDGMWELEEEQEEVLQRGARTHWPCWCSQTHQSVLLPRDLFYLLFPFHWTFSPINRMIHSLAFFTSLPKYQLIRKFLVHSTWQSTTHTQFDSILLSLFYLLLNLLYKSLSTYTQFVCTYLHPLDRKNCGGPGALFCPSLCLQCGKYCLVIRKCSKITYWRNRPP